MKMATDPSVGSSFQSRENQRLQLGLAEAKAINQKQTDLIRNLRTEIDGHFAEIDSLRQKNEDRDKMLSESYEELKTWNDKVVSLERKVQHLEVALQEEKQRGEREEANLAKMLEDELVKRLKEQNVRTEGKVKNLEDLLKTSNAAQEKYRQEITTFERKLTLMAEFLGSDDFSRIPESAISHTNNGQSDSLASKLDDFNFLAVKLKMKLLEGERKKMDTTEYVRRMFHYNLINFEMFQSGGITGENVSELGRRFNEFAPSERFNRVNETDSDRDELLTMPSLLPAVLDTNGRYSEGVNISRPASKGEERKAGSSLITSPTPLTETRQESELENNLLHHLENINVENSSTKRKIKPLLNNSSHSNQHRTAKIRKRRLDHTNDRAWRRSRRKKPRLVRKIVRVGGDRIPATATPGTLGQDGEEAECSKQLLGNENDSFSNMIRGLADESNPNDNKGHSEALPDKEKGPRDTSDDNIRNNDGSVRAGIEKAPKVFEDYKNVQHAQLELHQKRRIDAQTSKQVLVRTPVGEQGAHCIAKFTSANENKGSSDSWTVLGVLDFTCSYCYTSFKTNRELTSHAVSVHRHEICRDMKQQLEVQGPTVQNLRHVPRILKVTRI